MRGRSPTRPATHLAPITDTGTDTGSDVHTGAHCTGEHVLSIGPHDPLVPGFVLR